MIYVLSPREDIVVQQLAIERELTPANVMRQALAHYQHWHMRLAAGETVTWSGDKRRAREFRGPT